VRQVGRTPCLGEICERVAGQRKQKLVLELSGEVVLTHKDRTLDCYISHIVLSRLNLSVLDGC